MAKPNVIEEVFGGKKYTKKKTTFEQCALGGREKSMVIMEGLIDQKTSEKRGKASQVNNKKNLGGATRASERKTVTQTGQNKNESQQ